MGEVEAAAAGGRAGSTGGAFMSRAWLLGELQRRSRVPQDQKSPTLKKNDREVHFAGKRNTPGSSEIDETKLNVLAPEKIRKIYFDDEFDIQECAISYISYVLC